MYASVCVHIFFIATVWSAFCYAEIGNPVSIFEHTMQWHYVPLPSGQESRVLLVRHIAHIQHILRTYKIPMLCRFSTSKTISDGLPDIAERFADSMYVCAGLLDDQSELTRMFTMLLMQASQATQVSLAQKKQHQFANRALKEITTLKNADDTSRAPFVLVAIFMPEGDVIIPVHEVWNKNAYERVVSNVLAYKSVPFPYIRIQFNNGTSSQKNTLKTDRNSDQKNKKALRSWWEKIKQFFGVT